MDVLGRVVIEADHRLHRRARRLCPYIDVAADRRDVLQHPLLVAGLLLDPLVQLVADAALALIAARGRDAHDGTEMQHDVVEVA